MLINLNSIIYTGKTDVKILKGETLVDKCDIIIK